MQCPINLVAQVNVENGMADIDARGLAVIRLTAMFDSYKIFEFVPSHGTTKWDELVHACDTGNCASLAWKASNNSAAYIFVEEGRVEFCVEGAEHRARISLWTRLPAANC